MIRPLRLLPAPALLLAALGCSSRKPQPPTPLPTAPVRLADAGGAGTAPTLAMTLTAAQRATLSTRMAAAVRKVHVQEGAHVAAGQLLVSLSDEDLQAGLRAAEAGVAAAEAHFRRIESLMKQGAAIPAEMDQARTGLAQAQAAAAQVKANLGYTQIRAPFAGVIQARRVNEGDFTGPGMPLLDLEGTGALELVGTASETEARGLRVGQRLPFEAEGRMGTAEITALATGGDPISHRAPLRARLVTGAKDLRTGSFARLQLPARTPSDALTVPRSALLQRGELTGVFVLRDGRAQLRWLSLGPGGGDRVEVRAGLTRGEAVIDAPGELRDGQPVEVKR